MGLDGGMWTLNARLEYRQKTVIKHCKEKGSVVIGQLQKDKVWVTNRH